MSSQTTDAPPPAVRRSGAVDAVRVLGVAAVVVGHVWQGVPVRDYTFSWHVPVFFFLAGYLWKPGRTMGQEWRGRWRTLGVPYVCWFVPLLAVYVVVGLVTGTLDPQAVAGFVYGGHGTGRPFMTYWFLSVLLFTGLLYRAVSRLPVWAQFTAAAAGLALGYAFGPWLSDTPLSVGLTVICLSFVVVGAAARRVEPHLRHRLVLGLVMIVGPLLLIASDLVQPLDLKSANLGTPVLGVLFAIGICWGLLLVLTLLFGRLPQRASDVATALAVPAIAVVLSHPIVLWILQTPTDGRVLDLIVALLVPWGLGLALMRTRAAAPLLGVRRPPARSRVAVEVAG